MLPLWGLQWRLQREMRGTKWSDEHLEQLLRVGDPVADRTIDALFAQQNLSGIQRLLGRLVENDDPVPEKLPAVVRQYFDSVVLDPSEVALAGHGERFFALHGPEIMLVLCCRSLPFDYANARAVQVLYQTGFLAKRPNLRVAQTAQMIVDVMSPGGLSPDGRGLRSAQKVRLMHAAVRRMILADPKLEWDVVRLGVPINQADLLYTLMSFSIVVLEGLERLDLEVNPLQAQAYLDAWRVVGRIIGLEPQNIPSTIAEAKQLTAILQRRQHAPSDAGREMTNALAGLVGDVLGPLRGFRWSLLRFMCGRELSKTVGIPRRLLFDALVGVVAWIAEATDELVRSNPAGRRAFRWLSIRLIQHFIDQELGPKRRLFRIPTRLHDDWKHRRCSVPEQPAEPVP